MPRPSIRPVVWTPPPRPDWGALAKGAPELPLRILPVGGEGPEDVLVDPSGRILTGLADGRIVRLHPDGGAVETVADTGGRPLGLEWLGDGSLLVCDAHRGLLRVDLAGGLAESAVEVLATEAAGHPLVFCNNAAVAPDGTIYFTDSSQRFPIEYWMADVLEHGGTGRLLRRSPDGTIDVLADGLHFPNGVALVPHGPAGPDSPAVVFAQTGDYSLTSIPLSGPNEGRPEVLVRSLPGIPDNISTGSDGLIWVALASSRNPLLDVFSKLPGVFRRINWSLPARIQPGPARTTWVIGVEVAAGAVRVVHDVHGPGRTYHMVTGVREADGRLYLGSLVEHSVAVLNVPAE
jgi:sugar lactone lactonase YvrE